MNHQAKHLVSLQIKSMENLQEINPIPNDENGNENKPLPLLYSEPAIMGFAFFLSTLFASFLTIENMKTANAKKGILPVIVFTIVYFVSECLVIVALPKLIMLTILFNLAGGMILNLFFWKRYIPTNLGYEAKSIRKPLLISFILVALFLLLNGLTGVSQK